MIYWDVNSLVKLKWMQKTLREVILIILILIAPITCSIFSFGISQVTINNVPRVRITHEQNVVILTFYKWHQGYVDRSNPTQYWKVHVEPDRTLLIRCNNPTGTKKFFVKYGLPPTTSNFDTSFTPGPKARGPFNIENTKEGWYYIMVYSSSLKFDGEYFIEVNYNESHAPPTRLQSCVKWTVTMPEHI